MAAASLFASHTKTKSGDRSEIQQHHPLKDFTGQLHLCTFGFDTGIVNDAAGTEYTGKKGDSVIWLDARALPGQINVLLGLVEAGGYASILPMHEIVDLRLLHLVTSTVPWIYVMVAYARGPLLVDR